MYMRIFTYVVQISVEKNIQINITFSAFYQVVLEWRMCECGRSPCNRR